MNHGHRVALALSAIGAAANLGCGASTGLPTCGNSGLYCPAVSRTATMAKCSCTCSISVPGYSKSYGPVDVPICLPEYLNYKLANPSELATLEGLSETQLASDEASICETQVNQTLDNIAHMSFDACGLGSCHCGLVAQGQIDVPACDTQCSTVQCTNSNCKNVLVSDGTVKIDNCMCNQASACNNTGPTICRPPPGTADPPVLQDGLLTGFLAAQSSVSIDPSVSTASATISFTDSCGFGHSDTESSNLSGDVTLYGEPHPDGSADLVFEVGLSGTDATFHFSGVCAVSNPSVPITGIRMVGGTGSATVHVDSSGNGVIMPNSLSLRAGANVNGSQVYADSVNESALPIVVNFAHKTFSIPSFTASVAGVSGTFALSGTITNQPPRAVAPASQTIECTSPTGAPAVLDGSASFDPDNNIGVVSWQLGGGLNYGSVIATSLVADVEAPFSPPAQATLYTLTVTDTNFQMDLAQESITVDDTIPPTLHASVSPTCLWPPNHAVILFGLNNGLDVSVTDTCDAMPTFRILSVTSNQPTTGGGSGHTAPDVVFGDHAFCVRSERDGTVSTARTYAIVIQAKDASGNTTTQTLTVDVQHDQAGTPCASVPVARVVPDGDPACTAP